MVPEEWNVAWMKRVVGQRVLEVRPELLTKTRTSRILTKLLELLLVQGEPVIGVHLDTHGDNEELIVTEERLVAESRITFRLSDELLTSRKTLRQGIGIGKSLRVLEKSQIKTMYSQENEQQNTLRMSS